MKKLILSLVFVLATGTMMNAICSNDEYIETKTEDIDTVELFGCASDCVVSAKGRAKFLALMMDVGDVDAFKILYADCYYSNCA